MNTLRIVAGLRQAEKSPTVPIGALPKAANDPARFYSTQGTHQREFGGRNPLANDDIGVRRSRNQLPCEIAKKRGELAAHGSEPVGVLDCATLGARKQ